jgi:LmbE family N-acetylglucosaminyl deacetylase
LMAVHAHPDDESSSTGGVLAHYAAAGARTVVVTCTNGELGDGPGGIKPGEEGHDTAAVVATRLAELDEACRILDVTDLELLGYHDSGMVDWQYKDDMQAFCNVPIDESCGRLVGLFEKYRPDVVVTYDDQGGYDHPDHIQAHRITVAAVEQSGIPAKLYFTAWRRGTFDRLREKLRAAGVEFPEPEFDEEMVARMDAVEQRITTTVDTRAFAHQKRRALAAHASQIEESWLSRIPEELFVDVFGEESFIRAHDITGAPTPESDLFAGCHTSHARVPNTYGRS